jgi:radical SAM superfamily enzyme YgiQ (UPF0313 family)
MPAPVKIVLANLAGVELMKDGRVRHLAKAGSRWPMTVGHARHVDYYPFPFYLAYAAALLKKTFGAGQVKVIDGVALDLTADELLEKIAAEAPGIFIAEVTLITLKEDLALIRRVKARCACRVIVTGVFPSVFREKAIAENEDLDFAVYGEYETSLHELAAALVRGASGDELKGIPGIMLRDGGSIFMHPAAARVEDLDLLPFPDRVDLPARMYADFAVHLPCVSIISSRGCPAGCVYCVERHVTYASPRYRTRDAVSVVDEMEASIRRDAAKQFYFDDQSFVVNKEHVLKLCAEMKRRGLGVPWTCMGDAMFLDRPTLEAMAGAGCIGMKFGVESADQRILKAIHKPLSLDKVVQVAGWCRELGIMTHATFCIGLPGETEATAAATLKFIQELDVDSAQISKAVPYPGTPFHAWARDNGYLVTEDLDLYDGMAPSVLGYPGLPAARIDAWYARILKVVVQKKLFYYLKHPLRSLAMVVFLLRNNGLRRSCEAVWTFLRRSC